MGVQVRPDWVTYDGRPVLRHWLSCSTCYAEFWVVSEPGGETDTSCMYCGGPCSPLEKEGMRASVKRHPLWRSRD